MYWEACRPSILLAIHNPVVTAGLMWPPEMFIVAETITAIPTPCARATMSELTAPAFGPASGGGGGGTKGGARPPPPQHQRCVDAAEPERVRHHDLGGRGTAFSGEAVQVAGGIGALEVNRRGQPAPLHRQCADRRLDRPARAQGVSIVALGAADAQPVGVRAEHLLQRLRFRGVA